MNHYTDHDGNHWTINQTCSELSQDLYVDLVAAINIATQLQARCERLTDENRRLWAELNRLELVL